MKRTRFFAAAMMGWALLSSISLGQINFKNIEADYEF